MDAEDFELFAAIGFASAASRTNLAKIVCLDRVEVADEPSVCGRVDGLAAQLMTQPAGITKKRLLAGVRMNLRAADATTAHADDGFAFHRLRVGNLGTHE